MTNNHKTEFGFLAGIVAFYAVMYFGVNGYETWRLNQRATHYASLTPADLAELDGRVERVGVIACKTLQVALSVDHLPPDDAECTVNGGGWR